jgi:hypothetical protein
MSKKELREKLFSLYAANLSLYSPQYKDQFMCPLCKNLFTSSDLASRKLALAHAPPECVGGKIEGLACSGCDSTVGGKGDTQVKFERDSLKRKETDPIYATFKPAHGKETKVVIEGTPSKHILRFFNVSILLLNPLIRIVLLVLSIYLDLENLERIPILN